MVWLPQSGVVHAGDLLFNNGFPYINRSAGGTVAGVIANLEALVALLPHDIKIIPGHGPLASKADLETNLAMIRSTRAMVVSALGEGRTVGHIVAEGLSERWAGWGGKFVDEAAWIRILAGDAGP